MRWGGSVVPGTFTAMRGAAAYAFAQVRGGGRPLACKLVAVIASLVVGGGMALRKLRMVQFLPEVNGGGADA